LHAVALGKVFSFHFMVSKFFPQLAFGGERKLFDCLSSKPTLPRLYLPTFLFLEFRLSLAYVDGLDLVFVRSY
jgi:hypothetical protein